MKALFSLLFFIFTFSMISQTIPLETTRIKTIVATEYNNGDTLKHVVRKYYYDSLGAELYTKHLSKKAQFYYIFKSTEKHIQALISPNGDTSEFVVYLYDKHGNRTHNFQISMDGDTMVAQKRYYDTRGNCIELYNKRKDNSDFWLSMEWKYDNADNVILKKSYNQENKLVGLSKNEYKYNKDSSKVTQTSYKYVNEHGYVKESKIIRQNSIKKTYYYFDRIGYNYGIKLCSVKGGHSITTYYDDETLKSKQIFDKKKKLTASIYIMWKTL